MLCGVKKLGWPKKFVSCAFGIFKKLNWSNKNILGIAFGQSFLLYFLAKAFSQEASCPIIDLTLNP
jgi:hypothetical protein